MDETLSSFVSFCRICASQSNQVLNIFENIHNGVILAEMLVHCLKRPMNKIDGLPENICSNCKTNLIFTYEFHNLCEANEQYFLSKLPQNQNKLNECSKFESTHNTSQNYEATVERVKVEDDYELANQGNIVDESIDFDVRPSELVCVEENFDENSIIEESQEIGEPLQQIGRLGQRNTRRTAQLRSGRLKTDDKIFECFECKGRFEKLNELRQHMNEHENTRKPFECTTCNMRFVHLNSWFRHRSRHSKNIHECEYCSESFSTLTGIKQHIQEMHADKAKAYKCDRCSKEFALHFLLVCHYEWHKKAKKFICSTCDAVFFNERKLKAHTRDSHASNYNAKYKQYSVLI